MVQALAPDLEDIGRAAAQEVAGTDAVQDVAVALREIDDRVIYEFSFLIDEKLSKIRSGLLVSRLAQKLRDVLNAIDDDHSTIVRIFDQTDWTKRTDA
jgi:hypothetical protein